MFQDSDNIIKKIERGLANQTNIDKDIKKLRQIGQVDALLQIKTRILGIKTEEKYTLLMYFVLKNDYSKVKELLQGANPANPLVTNKVGDSALHLAIFLSATLNDPVKIIDELLKYEPEKQVVLQIETGETPLFLAVQEKNIELVAKLAQIQNKEQFLKKVTATGDTPLSYAVRRQFSLPLIQKLLEHFPEEQLLCADKQGMTPLSWALIKGNLEVVQQLLRFSPEDQLRYKAEANSSPLSSAMLSPNRYNLMQWLIQNYNFCIELKTMDNWMPLHIACFNTEDANLVILLLENGARSQILEQVKGFIPLSGTCQKNTPDIAKELLRYEPEKQLRHIAPNGFEALLSACYYGSLDVLKIIMQTIRDFQLNPEDFLLARNNKGESALHIAVSNPLKVEDYPTHGIITELLKYAPEKQLEAKTSDKKTALLIAVEGNNEKAVEKLVSYLTPDQFLAIDHESCTALYDASSKGYTNVVRKLLEQYAIEQMYTRRE